MALTLNMVGGGSGGGISGNTAVLEVIAPTGSTVSITDGVTTKTQTAADGHPISGRQTVEAYIFPIGSDELGDWTVTSARGTETNTTTITISAIMDYVVYIGYHVPLQTYQEVEYLQASGTQYLNNVYSMPSGWFSGETHFEIDAMPISSTGVFFGNWYNSGSNYYNSYWLGCDPNNKMVVTCGYTGNSADNLIFDYTNNTRYLIEIDGNNTNLSMKVNGVEQKTRTVSTYSTYPIPVFAQRNANSTLEKKMNGRVYGIRISKNGTDTLNLYPCYRLSDSVAGMYDKANGVFYTNAGTGTFTVGADV